MKKFFIIVGIFLGLIVLLGVGGFFALRSTGLREKVIQGTVRQLTHATNDTQTALVHRALGFDEPRTYLLLFLNNTELRPGGGFIGSYGVVRFDKGIPELLKVEGTEIIDNLHLNAFVPPPAAVAKYLKTTKMQFRDSNWSPDFLTSTDLSLDLYAKEDGLAAEELDGVVALTPTVMEEILEITGPIKVHNFEFNSHNFTEKLEYEVEFGYEKRGLDFDDRKQLLKDLVPVVIKRLMVDVFRDWDAYMALAPRLLQQKHVVLYSLDPQEQVVILQQNWGGAMLAVPHDYILWADANLGALKTDVVIDRSMTYSLKPVGNTYHATVMMDYVHRGTFNWRVSRYRDYARLYVPAGSKLISSTGAMETDRSTRPGVVDQGDELGRKWFGAFIAVEPGKNGRLSFTYEVSPEIASQIRSGQYDLLVQKQIGTLKPGLTLHLDFGKTIVGARPGEGENKHGDSLYDLKTTLEFDRQFQVTLGR